VRDARRLQRRSSWRQLTLGGDRHQDRLVHAGRLSVRPTAMISALALDRNHRDTGMPRRYREVARSLTPVSGHLDPGQASGEQRTVASAPAVAARPSRPAPAGQCLACVGRGRLDGGQEGRGPTGAGTGGGSALGTGRLGVRRAGAAGRATANKGTSTGSSRRAAGRLRCPRAATLARRPTRAVRACWRPSWARLSGVTWMRSGQRFVDAECKRFGLYQRPEEVSRSGHCGPHILVQNVDCSP